MTATPPRADLHALAAEAIWNDGMGPVMGPEALADAVLAAVLPEHRRLVLAEAAEALEALKPSIKHFWDTNDANRVYTLNDAVKTLDRLAAEVAHYQRVVESAKVRAQVLRDLREFGSGSDGWAERDRESDKAILRAVDALPDAGTDQTEAHDYLSTACYHGQHEHCRSTVNIDGDPKAPGTCKFCDAVCRCAQCRHGATDQTEDNHG